MKSASILCVAAGLLVGGLPAYAQKRVENRAAALPMPEQDAEGKAVNSPFIAVYRASGFLDDGGPLNLGTSTVLHCTNTSKTFERIGFTVRRADGSLAYNKAFQVGALQTLSVASHGTAAFTEDALMNSGAVTQGFITVLATTRAVVCTGLVVDAQLLATTGVPLNMVRFNPQPTSIK